MYVNNDEQTAQKKRIAAKDLKKRRQRREIQRAIYFR
jgi:hypothetical protein